MVPDEKRLKEDFKWLVNNTAALQVKNAGKFIAVVNKRIAGVGKTAREAYEKAKKAFPGKEPLLDLVPEKEFLLL
jgi:pyocin large subunit-like protein